MFFLINSLSSSIIEVEEMNMTSVASAIKDTIPISQFNRGLAGKIFEDVKTTGPKVVMKNNTAECVLMSPEEYMLMMDGLNDARLYSIAAERLVRYGSAPAVSEEEMDRRLGISKEDLDSIPEVDFE
jgi:PHD/YefM family antitoxin component YafN of YafNO toxin-antitoxin module